MKKLYTFLFLFFLTNIHIFAQNGGGKNENKNNSSTGSGLTNLANTVTVGLCDCFNKHAISTLTPTAKKALDKLIKKGIQNAEDFSKCLSQKEMEALGAELGNLDVEGGEFHKCQETVFAGMENQEGDLVNAMMESGGDEEKFQKAFEAEMVKVMKKNKTCEKFYYFYLIGTKK